MSISKRLMLLLAASMVALIVVASLSYTQMQRVFKEANYGNEMVVPSILTIANGQKHFQSLRIRVYRHVLNTDAKAMADIETTIEESKAGVAAALKAYEALISDDEDRRLLEDEKKAFAAYSAALIPTLDMSRQNRSEEALKALTHSAETARHLQQAFDAHMHYNEKLGQKVATDGAAAMSSATWTIAIVSIVAILIVGGLSMQIRSSLINRLNQANSIAGSIAQGDLSDHGQAADISNDEAGQLIQALEKMRHGLASTVGAIISNSHSLAASAAQLSTTAQQVSISTQSQSSSTASSAAAVEELTVSIDHVGSSADDASSEADNAGQLAIESGSGVQAASRQINLVAASVDQTAQQITSLSEQVQQIGNITTVIRDVADQTNLLALNAAIEAARAGEQGRGFAVVADEVRKLAERTTLSVQEISSVISAIQSSVAVAVDSMQTNRQQVTDVVQVADSASASMEGIRAATERVREAITGISEAMREQRSASTDLSRNVESIAQMSEENSAAVASVADTARALVGISESLKSEVARFRV